MTAADLRDQVMSKHKIGQVLTIWVQEAERTTVQRRVKIIAFNPNSILVESVKHKFKERFSYWDFQRIQIKPVPKPIVIPKKIMGVG